MHIVGYVEQVWSAQGVGGGVIPIHTCTYSGVDMERGNDLVTCMYNMCGE